MGAPDLKDSTIEERRQYIKSTFKCIADCDMCGLCTVFRGKDPELAYEDYINAINLNEEFDVNEQSAREGSSLLQEAISVKKWDIAMDLVQRGINVNIQDNHGNTALHYLCSKPECIQLAEKILEAGGNPKIYNDANMIPLYSMVADMNGNYINSGAKYEMIELLLKYGADKTLKCVDGNTSMDVAEIYKSLPWQYGGKNDK